MSRRRVRLPGACEPNLDPPRRRERGGEIDVNQAAWRDRAAVGRRIHAGAKRKQGGAEQKPTLDDVLIGVPPAQPIPMPQRPPAAKRINPIKLRQMQDHARQLEAQRTELQHTMTQWEQVTEQIEATA